MSPSKSDPVHSLRDLPLRDWHEKRGAVFGELGGFRSPELYDPDGRGTEAAVQREIEALRNGLALMDRSAFSRLELLGEDAVRFLGGLVTCDVAKLDVGCGTWGFFTGPKGQVLADVAVLRLADRLWLDLPPGRETAIREHLEKYVVADRVEIQPLSEVIPLCVVGPEAENALLRALAGDDGAAMPTSPWDHVRARLWGTELHICRHARLGSPGFVLFVPGSIADLVATDLAEKLGGEDRAARLVGAAAWQRLRVAAGLPLWGVDVTDARLPQEVEGDRGISYDKGCYLGQEVVARLHYRGQVPRQLRRLAIPEGIPDGKAPTAGQSLFAEGREAGQLTSVQPAISGTGFGALALLQRRAMEPGTSVHLGSTDGPELVVRALDSRALASHEAPV